MRITSEMMVTRSLQRLTTRLERYERVQSELGTGRRLLAPSDDPGSAARALSLRAAQRSRQQEARNASDAKARLNATDSTLQSVVEGLRRARDLAVSGASSRSARENAALAEEVIGIRDGLVGLANTRREGRALFGDYRDADAVAKSAAGWTFAPDAPVYRRVGERDQVQVNVSATEAFTYGPNAGDDTFAALDRLVADLQAGDNDAVRTRLGELDQSLQAVHGAQTAIGASTNRVEAAEQRLLKDQQSVRVELAELEDVDIAEAIMELQTQELAYQATLSALSKALPQSLVNFMR